jgi:signal transduction histidine kinase/DNA-binding response OmpR family regulator
MAQATIRPKILYIEDNFDARVLVNRLLSLSYEVLEAEDGLKGIALAKDTRPDLILVDLHMPHLTGYEVATRIKSLLPQVPIVALTADVTVNVRERVLASGCDGYLSKPIDPDTFADQVQAFLDGAREVLKDDSFHEAYRQALVARLEEKVRELTRALEHNEELYKQNLRLLKEAQRQARLLEAGARVGRSITSILDLDALLRATVDIICDEFDFYFAAIFLIDEQREWAVLRAGRGEAGQQMMEQGRRLEVGGQSMIGQAAHHGQARIALDVGQEAIYFREPLLPLTRSETALPLIVGNEVIGVLSVQSTHEAAFTEDDVTALQSLADQLAVAIDNARLLKRLESAHQELVRTKTYEAIATATGEAIHWVGNKAAPIPGSVARITEDVVRYLCMANALLAQAPADLREHKFAQMLTQAIEEMTARGIVQQEILTELEARPLERLRRTLSLESICEDLEIVQNSAQAILNLKEDLIGPARQSKIEAVSLPDLLNETLASMGVPGNVVQTSLAGDLPLVQADKIQLGRVFINLVKNAMEAMEHLQDQDKSLSISARPADEPGLVVVDVTDNGAGIPPDQLDQVWMAFYTTKGDRGGTGLGLPACAQIVGQLGGKMTVESSVGVGATFSVYLPAAVE